jgi:hypothetical protein
MLLRPKLNENKKEAYRDPILNSSSAEEEIKRWKLMLKETIALRINR